MLIGLNGRLGSGKDTVYKIMKEQMHEPVERLAFADPLKQSVAALFGITVEHVDELKNNPNIELAWCKKGDVWQTNEPPFTMRLLLQRYGTEAHRDVFGQNFWIDATLPYPYDHMGRVVVVTDMRFPNEMERVKMCGGICAFVERPEAAGSTGTHPSEQKLDGFDWIIYNAGTLGDLTDEVQKFIEHLGFLSIPI